MPVTNKLLSITFSTLAALAALLGAEEHRDDLQMERVSGWPAPQSVPNKDISKSAANWPKPFAGHTNLLFVVNLDSDGALPKIQEKRLCAMREWLKVNGQGNYAPLS